MCPYECEYEWLVWLSFYFIIMYSHIQLLNITLHSINYKLSYIGFPCLCIYNEYLSTCLRPYVWQCTYGRTPNFVCLFVAYLGWTLPGSSLRMRGLRTAAVLRHKGPAVPTSASFCLQKSHACWVSACFWTPRLSLGHPGSLTSVQDLKCKWIFNHNVGTLSNISTYLYINSWPSLRSSFMSPFPHFLKGTLLITF